MIFDFPILIFRTSLTQALKGGLGSAGNHLLHRPKRVVYYTPAIGGENESPIITRVPTLAFSDNDAVDLVVSLKILNPSVDLLEHPSLAGKLSKRLGGKTGCKMLSSSG